MIRKRCQVRFLSKYRINLSTWSVLHRDGRLSEPIFIEKVPLKKNQKRIWYENGDRYAYTFTMEVASDNWSSPAGQGSVKFENFVKDVFNSLLSTFRITGVRVDSLSRKHCEPILMKQTRCRKVS